MVGLHARGGNNLFNKDNESKQGTITGDEYTISQIKKNIKIEQRVHTKVSNIDEEMLLVLLPLILVSLT